MARSKWVVALAKGVRERSTDFRFDDLAVQRVPRPPAVEQYAIVDYVRGIRRCFRQLTNLRTREIELLEEQYEGALLKAVTRGLRPNRRLKASGVDWLGDIPEDWDVAKLKSLVERFASGSTPRGGATVYEDHGIPFLRSQNIHFDGLRATTTFIGTQTHERMRASRVLFGDVLLNITGASIGRACAVIEKGFEANVNQHICIIRPHRKRLESEYLAFALSTQPMQGLIEVSATGASREGLRMDDIRDFRVPLPPRDEQLEIVDYVRTKSAAVRAAVDLANRQIVHLAEYQTRLISDVVTGKLDVREAAVKLPDDLGELETVISDRLETASAADLA